MNDLNKCAKIIVDLFEHGASYVEIGDGKIRVSKKEYEQLLFRNNQNQNTIIQLVNNISTNIKIDNEELINQVLSNFKNNELNQSRIIEVEKNLNLLLEETKKERPRWINLKNIMQWALEFSKDIFIQLIPIYLKINNKL